ncbi:hypothetical protein HPP92_022949 [Vanilla planifolia]|uniref:Secreted protein n=1 Tax=Vanilla planifolia TaxID=51239 RepID=A0A835UDN7_VANPL|nr:hypothetical protein HPP92_022949 [Vanilla planifolia]
MNAIRAYALFFVAIFFSGLMQLSNGQAVVLTTSKYLQKDSLERKGTSSIDHGVQTSASKGRGKSVRPQQATTEDKKP